MIGVAEVGAGVSIYSTPGLASLANPASPLITFSLTPLQVSFRVRKVSKVGKSSKSPLFLEGYDFPAPWQASSGVGNSPEARGAYQRHACTLAFDARRFVQPCPLSASATWPCFPLSARCAVS